MTVVVCCCWCAGVGGDGDGSESERFSNDRASFVNEICGNCYVEASFDPDKN